MTRAETTLLKGVAILLMLYLHLFNTDAKIELCQTYINVANAPLLLILTRATNPVHFFILLSGYGLYMSYLCGKRNQSKRIFKLYVHYWLTLIAFVFIGYFIIGREVYPGSWIKIVENVTGWHTSYNGEIWFLFPYCLVAITSSLIFYLVDKVNSWTIFMATGIIYFATHVAVSMFGSSFLYSH